MNSDTLPGLYIHVPFCRTKCLYCDFYSEIDAALIPGWLSALEKEAAQYKDRFPSFDTLYIGGGTPTVLENSTLLSLFGCLYQHFQFTANAEITIEANPQDITREKLRILHVCSVNRISIGVQSLAEQDLQFLQRRHTAREAEQALELARACGFTNIGVDLIYGIPGQKIEAWLNTLERIVSFHPEHISCYHLTVAQGTRLWEMQESGMVTPADEKEGEAFFLTTAQFLEEHGYLHYEISNFARGETNCSRHNQKYWQHISYLGLGPAAHSFQQGSRWWNHRSVARYCQDLEEGRAPVGGTEKLSGEQLHLEALSLGLRTRAGLDLAQIRTNKNIDVVLKELLESEYAQIIDGRLIPTRKGFLVADRLPLTLL
jgi:oxygen-independent coproporphyrinogen-3 oxidase